MLDQEIEKLHFAEDGQTHYEVNKLIRPLRHNLNALSNLLDSAYVKCIPGEGRRGSLLYDDLFSKFYQ